jgi:glutamyl-tRNA synthetase
MVRTRFSPSPTGLLHLGNVRAALLSALFAEKNQGAFILRIEDTDQTRSEDRFADLLQEDLHWLGIHWQEGPGVEGPNGPYWQSQRYAIYARYYQELEELGRAYPCFCTDQALALNRKIQLSRGHAPRYPGTCQKLSKEEVSQRIAAGEVPTLRFRVPTQTAIEFVDLVKGSQHFNSDDIGDFIIRRADGGSSFMFCNAIDDSLMGVTNILRGEDHLSNTPRQLMILQALKMRTPQYGHLSMIMGEDGTPLSKRHGSFSLHDLRQKGFLPLAVLNYLARLGHTYDEQKLMTFSELAAHFNLEKISRSSARFDINQLLYWQKEAVLALSPSAILEWLGENAKMIPEKKRDLFIELMRQNSLFPSDMVKWIGILFQEELLLKEEDSVILKEAGEDFFVAAKLAVEKHGIDLKSILEELKATQKISGKRLFIPIRIALTAEQHGPELVHIATLLDTRGMLQRFQQVIELVRK